MSLPQYPKYKNSGVAWLGDIPEHWELAPLKRGFDVCLGKMLQPEASSAEDLLLPYLRAANVQWCGVDIADVKNMWFSEKDRNQLKLLNGDLLISEGGDVGRSAIWHSELEECYIQNSINRVRGRLENQNRFLYYWISTIKNKGYIDVICNKSTIAHFTAEKVAAVPVPFPPSSEQTTIAAFLDRETAKIDALIAEQEKLITLLAEKRQATISHAVTKGLNPNAPMKNSGVAWLGDVPEHWEITPIKGMALLKGGAGFPDNEQGLEGEELGFYKVAALGKTDTYILLSAENTVSRDTAHRLGAFVFPERTIVFAKVGAALLLGRIKELPEAACIDNNMMGMVINQAKIDVSFLRYAMSLVRFDLIANPGAVPSVNAGQIGNFQLTNPPLAEQTTIAAFLDRETAKIDALTAEAKRGIGLLKERRAALISAAVTGKINVCDFV